jgi:archaellum biogenesis ATPase FlaH
MTSVLVITGVENLQEEILRAVKPLQDIPGVYVSLNKTQKSTEDMLKRAGIKTDKLFFIDCVTEYRTREDVLHIAPQDLLTLAQAVDYFIKEIPGEKFLIIDALSTLLIYNDENKVAQFVRQVTETSSEHDVSCISFSPSTKGEDLLNKIFNFFDEVLEK